MHFFSSEKVWQILVTTDLLAALNFGQNWHQLYHCATTLVSKRCLDCVEIQFRTKTLDLEYMFYTNIEFLLISLLGLLNVGLAKEAS